MLISFNSWPEPSGESQFHIFLNWIYFIFFAMAPYGVVSARALVVTPRLVHNGRHVDDGGHGRPASNHRDGDNETESESAWRP